MNATRFRRRLFLYGTTVSGLWSHRKGFAAPRTPAGMTPAESQSWRRRADALGRGVRAFRKHKYQEAIAALKKALDGSLYNPDYAEFYLAEAYFAAGQPARSVPLYARVARQRHSRFSDEAVWRRADALWENGDQGAAVSIYERARQKGGGALRARGLYRMGVFEEAAGRKDAASEWFESVLAQHPSAPEAALAESALKTLSAAGDEGVLPPTVQVARAKRLTDKRKWYQALGILDGLPKALPAALAADKDLALGRALYKTRKNYDRAAAVLLDVAPRLSGGEAAWAAFHGARALSRADRDDEAIVKYRKVVSDYPQSSWAAEAQFLAGWLSFNATKFEDGVDDLEAALRMTHSRFASSAAWYLALSYDFLGEPKKALSYLERFAHLGRGRRLIWPAERTQYWRARFLEKLGETKASQALDEGLVRENPLNWYGLLSGRRLLAQGRETSINLPPGAFDLRPPRGRDRHDPVLRRVDELVDAELPADAGVELDRGARALIGRLGPSVGLHVVISRSQQAETYHAAYRLASTLGSRVLSHEPKGNVRTIWEAAYPLAFAKWVEPYGAQAGNPPHYLYAIMRKESGFDPNVVSYADARGLLQMIPPTSRRVAKDLDFAFEDDDLYDPETNIRLGATYIGALYNKFKHQVPLAAGAYNAGPVAMARWCERFGTMPLDAFAEMVTYQQTREYLKRVTGIYATYRYLYAKERFLPSLQLDAEPLATGPHY